MATFDRALATAKLAISDATPETVAASDGFDLARVARLTARNRHITGADERATFGDRFVALQPNLDESSWWLRGQLPALDGSIVEQALSAYVEALPPSP